jgi:hypothetical protein
VADGLWAVVLAGRRNDGRLAVDPAAAAWEALIDVAGRPMAARVLDALGAARSVGGGALVGPAALVPYLPAGFERVEPVGDTLANLAAGLGRRPDAASHVLVATSDIPLVSAAMVDAFVAACGAMDQDVYFPVVRREVAEARFPGVRRTYVRLRDGAYTAGNLFVVRAEVLPPAASTGGGLLDKLVRWRKAPWRMALGLGPGLVWAVASGRWDLARVEREASRRLGVRGRAVVVDDPEVGVDVDKPGDLALCREVLGHAARS